MIMKQLQYLAKTFCQSEKFTLPLQGDRGQIVRGCKSKKEKDEKQKGMYSHSTAVEQLWSVVAGMGFAESD